MRFAIKSIINTSLLTISLIGIASVIPLLSVNQMMLFKDNMYLLREISKEKKEINYES